MGEVFQFRRAPQVQARNSGGFSFRVNPGDERWAHRDRGPYRIAPDVDGTVVLEVGAKDGAVIRVTLSVEDAERLRDDIRDAATFAEKMRQRARGANRWITTPVDGRDAFVVTFEDKTATFAMTKVRRAHRCQRCGDTLPAGSAMYRQRGPGKHRWRGGASTFLIGAILHDMNARVCRACMTPPI
jgi:hypothetical protein